MRGLSRCCHRRRSGVTPITATPFPGGFGTRKRAMQALGLSQGFLTTWCCEAMMGRWMFLAPGKKFVGYPKRRGLNS